MHGARSDRGNFQEFWTCGNKKKKGSTCPVKGSVPEKILEQETAAVLGMGAFDGKALRDRVDHISVPERRVLVFHLKNGSEIIRHWVSTAKKDCWTDEYKDRQREWVHNFMARDDTKFSAFTTRMRCGVCGGPLRRATQTSATAADGKQKYWRCATAAKCGVRGIREEVLEEISARLLGIADFDGDAFRERVDHIDAFPGGRLEFFFTDGSLQQAGYSTKRKGKPWTDEQRAKFSESVKKSYTPERRKAMSEHMKQVRSKKYWISTGKERRHGDDQKA